MGMVALSIVLLRGLDVILILIFIPHFIRERGIRQQPASSAPMVGGRRLLSLASNSMHMS